MKKILLAAAAAFSLFAQAQTKEGKVIYERTLAAAWGCIFLFGIPKVTSGKAEDLVFGIIVLFVLTPIIVGGLAVFGWYALKGEYDAGERESGR